MKIKDRILLGSITGALVSAPFQVLDVWMHKRGGTDVAYGRAASRLFLAKKKAKSPGGGLIAAVVNTANSSAVATAIVYTLSLTGRDHAVLKGAGMGALMWVAVAGAFSNLGLNIKSKRPSTPLRSLMQHVLFGGISSYVITKLGDDGLFPNSAVGEEDQIPVFAPMHSDQAEAQRSSEKKALGGRKRVSRKPSRRMRSD